MTFHPSRLEVADLLSACDVRRQRRSGPGGQHRNKVETGIFVQHVPSGIRAEATERRSQQQNLQLAVHRLRVSLAVGLRCPVEDSPSRKWCDRIRAGRIEVSHEHDEFPSLLAESLDVLASHGWQLQPAAKQLRCSSSQLTKFLKRDPRGLAEFNRQREVLGLGRLQ